ncbi:MAG: hypothetical protein ACYCO5_13430 [Acidobacteriaceae bacterium]
MGDMFQQPILEVENPAAFEPVKATIEAAFAPPSVGKYLERVERARLRIRDFETLREQGLLGETVKSGYEQLGNSDRGQIRELYLRSVEQVAPELRKKYLKIYAYY